MPESKLYELIEKELMQKWRDEIEETEKNAYCFKAEQKAFKELEKVLKEEEKHLLQIYSLAMLDKLDYIHFQLKIKTLNFGINVGQELQKAFLEDSEDAE